MCTESYADKTLFNYCKKLTINTVCNKSFLLLVSQWHFFVIKCTILVKYTLLLFKISNYTQNIYVNDNFWVTGRRNMCTELI